MLPNIFAMEAFGKLLFVACDLAVGYILFQFLRLRGQSESSELLWNAMPKRWGVPYDRIVISMWFVLHRCCAVHLVRFSIA